MMEKISVKNQTQVAEHLATLISSRLTRGNRVLWFISGGSSIPIARSVIGSLDGQESGRLQFCLVDDYRNSPDEVGRNWQDLLAPGLNVQSIESWELLPKGVMLDKAARQSIQKLSNAVEWADFTIGQFGVGAGYHTGGIQPRSNETRIMDYPVASYILDGIEHLTVTPGLIKQLDVVFINSMGESKRPLVGHFLTSMATVYDEPTQILKMAQKTVLCSDVLN